MGPCNGRKYLQSLVKRLEIDKLIKQGNKMLHSLITLLLLAAPLAATAAQSQQTEESMHRLISATQLKSWYDQNQ